MTPPLLTVRNLSVEIKTPRGTIRPVDAVSFEVPAGGALGIVGESGSGKTLTLRAILGLLPTSVAITGGSVLFRGEDITASRNKALRRLRGHSLSMVFQEPLMSLNPVMRVGDQIGEGLLGAFGRNAKKAKERAVELLGKVGIADPDLTARLYPYELSGGMQQRVMIAMALADYPEMILCDEPTTALDVTVQDQILDLLATLRQELGLAIVLVTHDLGVVAETCDDVAVMYAGSFVEQGPAEKIFGEPAHPYTLGLLRATPRLELEDRGLEPIPGTPPDLRDLPDGCHFHPRCNLAVAACTKGAFPLLNLGNRRSTACIRHEACRSLTVSI
jgi:oligopeptide/dipeptide ABC transporter ATP-binding protein